jgi:hypothetical protein
MAFPNNFLPSNSQPWGREVQKRIELAEIAISRNERNGDARDTQLAAAFDRLNATVIKSEQALEKVFTVEEAVYYPGTTEIDGANIRANTIAANKISAGELVGFTVKTDFDGQRVELNSDRITFIDSNDDYAGAIFGSAYSGVEVSGSFGVSGSSGFNGLVTALGGVNVGQSSGGSTAMLNAYDGITVGSGSKSGAVVINNPGGAIGSNYLQVPDTYVRTVASGRIVYVSSAGTYNCSTSSARYKQDISPYEVDIDKLLLLQPVSFRYKQSVQELGENADVAHGFIAEQAEEVGLGEFVDFEVDEEGNPRPDNFRYIDFTAALLSAVKQQQATISDLTARLEALENRV